MKGRRGSLRNLLVVMGAIGPIPLAALTLAPLFTDNMVLQRDTKVPVWGSDQPATEVRVTFGQQSVRTVADASGRWMVRLQPMEASSTPRELVITGSSTLTVSDVLVGDVWLCSGQSNMEKPLGQKQGQRPTENFQQTLQSAGDPLIRIFQVPHYGRVKKGAWQMRWLACSAEALVESEFSATGYYFARTLREHSPIPLGIIHSSFGGSMIEAWIPSGQLEEDPVLKKLLRRRYFAWVDGVQATELYQSMIQPLVPFALKGFLWYQGEANAMYAESSIYTRKMQALIHSWRKAWNRPEAPFLFVQLAPFNYSEWDKFPRQLTPEALPLFREAQAAALAVPQTGMVVTTDLGGRARDIHPIRKREVGERLAWLALNKAGHPGHKELPESPCYAASRISGGEIIVDFSGTGTGLQTRDNEPPTGFVIAGRDKVFHPAAARLDGSSVRLSAPEVPDPVAIRFAWNETANPNLVSSAGLPVTPFRTDNWEIQNEK